MTPRNHRRASAILAFAILALTASVPLLHGLAQAIMVGAVGVLGAGGTALLTGIFDDGAAK